MGAARDLGTSSVLFLFLGVGQQRFKILRRQVLFCFHHHRRVIADNKIHLKAIRRASGEIGKGISSREGQANPAVALFPVCCHSSSASSNGMTNDDGLVKYQNLSG